MAHLCVNMNNRIFISIILISLLAVMNGCKPDHPSFKVKPSALGVMNEIVVISDDDIWEGSIGDSLRYYFGGAYPITPQPEPIFDLKQYNVLSLEAQPLRKELRTYLIVGDLTDSSSETAKFIMNDLGEAGIAKSKSDPDFTSSVGRNKWATGQILVYLFADGIDNLAAAIGDNFASISSLVRQHDDTQLSQLTYSTGVNRGLSREIASLLGVESIEIPSDFEVVKKYPESQSVWLRKDVSVRKVIKDEFSRDQRADIGAVMNIVLGRETYTSESQLSKEAMKDDFNAFGRTEVSSPEPDSYLLLNDRDLPILEFSRDVDGQYTKEYRGIWEMENDFLGGPILSYRMVSGDNLVWVNSFVLAVGTEKRDFIQQIEKIVSNIKFSPT